MTRRPSRELRTEAEERAARVLSEITEIEGTVSATHNRIGNVRDVIKRLKKGYFFPLYNEIE